MNMKNNQKFKHVFLITVDALRADHVGCIGGGNLTPNIDKMAKNGLLFTRAFSNGPGTNQSFPALMTSTYFLMHNGFHLSPHYDTLAEVLRENGFKTAGFHSNPFISKMFGWDRGFEEFYDFMDELKAPSAFITRKQGAGVKNKFIRFLAEYLGGTRNTRMRQFFKKIYYQFSGLEIPYLEGKELNKHVFRWIDRNSDGKFFLWMHYMDAHYPYIPSEEFCDDFSTRKDAFEFNMSVDGKKASDYDIETLRGLYRGEVRYADSCVGELIGFLENKGLMEGSLIILASDHGEAFMEHGSFGHKPDSLYNEVLHVPLLIHGLDYTLETDIPVQLLDIPPSIFDILNISRNQTSLGNSLISIIENNTVDRLLFSESAKPDLINLTYNKDVKAVSCIFGKWKVIINDLLKTKELYNIVKDFQEKENLSKVEMDVYKELKFSIDQHLIYMRAHNKKWVSIE